MLTWSRSIIWCLFESKRLSEKSDCESVFIKCNWVYSIKINCEAAIAHSQHVSHITHGAYTLTHTHKPIGFIKSTNSHMKCPTKIEIISRNTVLVGLLPPTNNNKQRQNIALICKKFVKLFGTGKAIKSTNSHHKTKLPQINGHFGQQMHFNYCPYA